ncbi:hypothetical protein CMI47_06340 [Candidatus Pacearchaeota archaeon]|nr:hypothetical protein [Candidatus Pacearchaeota archaeon]|tara:strand:- start:123 stop:491 length:369 start_codon:yes stop_codon:yes gene_type:complete
MSSLAVKIPLTRDSIDGFAMIKDIRTLIKQNFKMLLLTNPGERVMEPEFGVGMRRFLFSNFTQETFNSIEADIRSQVAIYLPVISILEISFGMSEEHPNSLDAEIRYLIPAINVEDLLEFTI